MIKYFIFLCMLLAAPALAQTEMPLSVVYPVLSSLLTSSFGQRMHPIKKHPGHHNGVDIAAKAGDPVLSVYFGKVVFTGTAGGLGQTVVIVHKNGLTSHYAHLSQIDACVGQVLRPGDIIGRVGDSGESTGPHLHFEIRRYGEALDPAWLLPRLDARALG